MPLARWDLLQFLKHAKHASHLLLQERPFPVYVLGNPSADLDSIISAILYSYFASSSPNKRPCRQYVPLINLPDVRSGKELSRLRPEFVTALNLATSTTPKSREVHTQSAKDTSLGASILTVADFRELFYCQREAKGRGGGAGSDVVTSRADRVDVVMVDWNALPLSPDDSQNEHVVRSGSYEDIPMSILGCIDHHHDESFIASRPPGERPELYEPRCIQTGVGSCTSLVVRELRSRGMWIDAETQGEQADMNDASPSGADFPSSTENGERQAAKLALAAILADTANMTAESKVSDVDRAAVSFLERKIASTPTSDGSGEGSWDRQSFYDAIVQAKSSSVENLTMDEILGRDYKEWSDTSQTSNDPVKIGFCNVVKPLSWILQKASQTAPEPTSFAANTSSPQLEQMEPYDSLLTHLSTFSHNRGLDVVVLMTVFTSPPPDEEFGRELLIWDLNDAHKAELERFEAVATKELCLAHWRLDQQGDTSAALSGLASSASNLHGGYRGIWKQMDVSKSRKQVAPLVREALSGKLSL